MADWHKAATTATSTEPCADGSSAPSPTSPSDSSSPPPPPPHFDSRRSPVLCLNGCVASSQPLASSIGLRVLRDWGGNAADAAVAVAAALAVLEPCSTGLGGDAFALHYDAVTKRVESVNGSGRCPALLTIDRVLADCGGGGAVAGDEAAEAAAAEAADENFTFSAHAVTVPGAAQAWEDTLNKHGSGRLSLQKLLEPAIELALQGFPVAPLTARAWADGMPQIQKWCTEGEGEKIPLTTNGKDAPRPGQVFRNPDLAKVLRSLGERGAREGFYDSWPGERIAQAVQKHGGVLTKEDVVRHAEAGSTFPTPICVEYEGVNAWQCPPNGQGVAGLIALRGLAELERRGLVDGGGLGDDDGDGDRGEDEDEDEVEREARRLHAMIETMRLGFADARSHVADVQYNDNCQKDGSDDDEYDDDDPTVVGSTAWLLSPERITSRINSTFDPRKAVAHGMPPPKLSPCTVSFQVVDREGNAMSFVNSNFMGFGTGMVPDGCGFTLQNRGYGFSLDPKHPNALEGGKRPYHTILPGIATFGDTGGLYATFSNMGGYMQPQGHLQLLNNLLRLQPRRRERRRRTRSRGAEGQPADQKETLRTVADPQEAIDAPRFCIADGTRDGVAFLEEGWGSGVLQKLVEMGHHVHPKLLTGYDRGVFGRAQIILRDKEEGVWWAGSDGRADGCAMGY